MPGYSDKENVWEKIWNLDRLDQGPCKFKNDRSDYYLCVTDKQLKLKRNPLLEPVKKIVKE